MELIKKKVIMHGNQTIFIVTPAFVNPNISAGHDNKGYVLIWGNGNGYQYLAECFAIAAELKNDEILYIPTEFKENAEFKETFGNCEYRLNIVCTNYCETQISPKDIERALQIKFFSQEIVNRFPVINTEYMDRWKIDRRLTVKIHKRNMYISTNRDGFYSLTSGACNMAEYGDKYYDDFLPHVHYDWNENTSSSIGVTLYHWHNK